MLAAVGRQRKTEQLQIRVSAKQKRAIQEQARRAGVGMSEWVLARLLPSARERFQELLLELSRSEDRGSAFAELLDFLSPLAPREYAIAVAEPPRARFDTYWANYVAATVEHGSALKRVHPPPWTRDVRPLDAPAFASSLMSLRLHLLVNSPPAFSRRNLFIDATLGDRV